MLLQKLVATSRGEGVAAGIFGRIVQGELSIGDIS
jgi:hypothetical protein